MIQKLVLKAENNAQSTSEQIQRNSKVPESDCLNPENGQNVKYIKPLIWARVSNF